MAFLYPDRGFRSRLSALLMHAIRRRHAASRLLEVSSKTLVSPRRGKAGRGGRREARGALASLDAHASS